MPAYGNFLLDKGYDCDAVTTKFRAVKAGATPESVTPCTVLGEDGVGISQFGVTAAELTKGKGCAVRREGISEWEVGSANAGVVGREVDVTVAADGRCQVAAAGHRVWGKALMASTAAGQRIPVEIATVKYIKA